MAEIIDFQNRSTTASAHEHVSVALEDLFGMVGDRVRAVREKKGISRRVLSEISGVSPRYLAQLEAGAGNISIGLLQRVALALDYKIEWLVGDDITADVDVRTFADRFAKADEETKRKVMELLNQSAIGIGRANRICLLGLRGAGKSTLGRMASKHLGVKFVELNREIEAAAGMPAGDIIALYGQEGYRQLERNALGRVIAENERVILAVAGGIVSEPATYETLLINFHSVWVKASPDEHMARVREQGDERPMEGNPRAMEQLHQILASREKLYEKAQAVLDTTGLNEQHSLNDLLTIIDKNKFLS